jgi:hypothetical protein
MPPPSALTTSDSETGPKIYECCTGCGKDKLDKKTEWIECSQCRGWWHCLCANISKTDSNKLDIYRVNYTCAFCALSLSILSAINTRVGS